MIFKLPEHSGSYEESKSQDKSDVQKITNIITSQEAANVTTRRLGKKGNNPRPLLVSYDTPDAKTGVMRNLHKLKASPPPFDNISIRHDMSKTEREREKKLQEEAKLMNQQQQVEDLSFVMVVRGQP